MARHRPDAVAVESAFYGKNVRTTLVLSHARGVILLAAEQAGVTIAEYSPALVKKTIVGRGAALKSQVGYMVAQLLRLKSPPAPSRCGRWRRGGAHPSAHRLAPGRVLPPGHRRAMIAMVSGVVAAREGDTWWCRPTAASATASPFPPAWPSGSRARGDRVSLHTELVVKEDGWALYGFDRPGERLVFQRLLGASGFGPKLALALLSALGPERTVRSIRARDLAALSSVGGIGRKKAERLVLELQDRFDDVPLESPRRPARPEATKRCARWSGWATAPGPPMMRCGRRSPGAPPPRTPHNSSAGRSSSSPRGEGG